ncbi:MAG TPA: universal stress protein [Gemmatimonadales bacterium]|nr:universal stress protein [Gemmatimonadales bacterium]
MFTRLLVGLDESPRADQAFEQALLLAQRFQATVIAAYARESGGPDGAPMLERARLRALERGVAAEVKLGHGAADVFLAEVATQSDAVLVGRRGARTGQDAIGPTVASLIRIAERVVIVCGATPSPMQAVAIAYDGRETSRRALDLAARFASIVGSTIHVIHANPDREAGVGVVGEAEASLSLLRVAFVTHVEKGKPAEVVARVIAETKCDALFAGAHMQRQEGRPSQVTISHAEEILRHTDIPVAIQP